jgi:hypothetical protein
MIFLASAEVPDVGYTRDDGVLPNQADEHLPTSRHGSPLRRSVVLSPGQGVDGRASRCRKGMVFFPLFVLSGSRIVSIASPAAARAVV